MPSRASMPKRKRLTGAGTDNDLNAAYDSIRSEVGTQWKRIAKVSVDPEIMKKIMGYYHTLLDMLEGIYQSTVKKLERDPLATEKNAGYVADAVKAMQKKLDDVTKFVQRTLDAAKKGELTGEGIFDYFKPRDTYNNTSRKTLAALGSKPVVAITLSRAPIKTFLRKALDVVSLGAFSKAAAKYGFDKLFHLSMLVDVDMGGGSRKRVVVEKNAVINISSGFKAESDAEYLPVQLPEELTLDGMMAATKTLMGAQYYPYNAWTNNCQVFIDSILKASHLLTPAAHSWLFQDISKLAGDMPEVSKDIANAITYTGAVADKLAGNGKHQITDKEMQLLIEDAIKRVEARRRKN